MRATTTLIAAAAIAAPLLVSARPSPLYTDLYAREEFAPYVSARDAYDTATIFRRGGRSSEYTKQSDQEPMSANQKTLEEQDESNMRKHRASINAWAKAWNDHRNNPANTPSAGMPPRPPVLVSDKYKPKSSRPRREDLSTRALLVRALLEELD